MMKISNEDARIIRNALRYAGRLAEVEMEERGENEEYEVRAGEAQKRLAKALGLIEGAILASIMEDMSLSALQLTRGGDGSGSWSLFAPGTTPEDVASGDAKPLLSGDAEWVEGYRWSRPTRLDYVQARSALARAQLDGEGSAHV